MSSAAASPALQPPAGNERFPLVDGLRALAALSVVVYHVGLVSGLNASGGRSHYALQRLNVGVTLFFVISGFLLYRPYVSARLRGTPRPTARQFFRRRLLRIVPAYWAALAILVVWPGLNGVTWSNWPLFAFFGQVYSARHSFDGDPVAWSLCTEMSFYLLLPLYALLADRWLKRARTELVALSLLGLAGLAVGQAVLTSGHAYLTYSMLGTFDWFAIGMVFAVLAVDPLWSARLGRLSEHSGLLWTAALVALLASNAVNGGTPLNVAFAVVAALTFLPAIVRNERSAPARALGTPAAAWLGLVSYGVYLWHLPLAQEIESRLPDGSPVSRAALLLVPAVLLAVTAGALSYYVVELPFLRRKDRAARRPAAL